MSVLSCDISVFELYQLYIDRRDDILSIYRKTKIGHWNLTPVLKTCGSINSFSMSRQFNRLIGAVLYKHASSKYQKHLQLNTVFRGRWWKVTWMQRRATKSENDLDGPKPNVSYCVHKFYSAELNSFSAPFYSGVAPQAEHKDGFVFEVNSFSEYKTRNLQKERLLAHHLRSPTHTHTQRHTHTQTQTQQCQPNHSW